MGYAEGDSLKVRIRIAFGASIADPPSTWTWTDVTPWWHTPADVTIGWGRGDGAEQPETSTLALTLKNVDGRFTAHYPMSPYWPHVVAWTPIAYDIDLGDGAGWRNRFSGYVRKWPVAWPGGSSRMALARIEAVGLLGRQARGKPPARSPMRRDNTNPAKSAGLLAYWPLEDGADSTEAASAVPGVAPMVAAGKVTFANSETLLSLGGTRRTGTMPLPSLLAGGSLTGLVPAGSSSPVAWGVRVYWRVNDASAAGVVLMRWETPGGTHVRWEVVQNRGGVYGTYLVAYTAGDAATVVWSHPITFGGPDELVITGRQSGGNIAVRVEFGLDSGLAYSAAVAGTAAHIASISLNPDRAVLGGGWRFEVGHLQVFDRADIAPRWYLDAMEAWRGEPAHERVVRLAAEDGISCTADVVPAGGETLMGSQPDSTLLELLGECERTDQGMIYEEGFGLGYLPRAARYNAPVALTIDGSRRQLGMPFEPVTEDQRLRNVWAVSREGGSSAPAADKESIDAQGEIEASVTVNLYDDSRLADDAHWRLHQSTVREPRYPSLSIDLYAHPELAAAWVECRPGSRVQVVNPPPQAPPGTVDQLIVGASETYQGRRGWKVTMNVVPASPWIVGEYAGPEETPAPDAPSRYDTYGSILAADYQAGTDTTISVATVDGPAWTTDPAALPLDLWVDGVRVRVTEITGTTSPQTMTVQRDPINGVVKSIPAGRPVRLWQPAVYAL